MPKVSDIVGAAAAGVFIGMMLERFRQRGGGDEEDFDASPPIRKDVEYKMVLCVRNDLKMGKGKIGAQCSHATLGLYSACYEKGYHALLDHWEEHGQAKVTLKLDGEQEMLRLAKQASSHNVPCHIVHDAGRTQIAPNTRTVLSIGPAPVDELDKLTGHLKLL
ncbi:hypothetical protein CYMTET_51634 [Cymbomonas tetramitiformis]|uniref:peptidyl-tRNA hydrolase n=1 Tax=Cymbomonas tetramitiformis TaxID=36881 RepID=A0AAE0BKR6_9CHLO|nr:hypothetical protein CYMTET_51634 [Cymbomonas tetramitiformis]|eukprot:gene22242-26824_t